MWKSCCFRALLLMVLLAAGGCAPTYTGACIEPYKTYFAKPGQNVSYEKAGEIQFRRVGFDILGIPIFTPDIVATLDRHRQALGADAVKDVAIYSDGIFIAAVMFPTYKVEATAIRFKGGL